MGIFGYLGNDALTVRAGYLNDKKGNPAKQKPSCNQDCRMGIAKLFCLLPGKCQAFPACPCLPGPHKVSSALSEAGIASVPALCGWVTGLSLGGCQEEHLGPVFSDFLHLRTRSSGLYLFTVLVCTAAITPLVRFPITKMLTKNHLNQMGNLCLAVLDLFV